MLMMILLMALAVCIYWDYQEHAPEKVCVGEGSQEGVPLAASVREISLREEPRERIAS